MKYLPRPCTAALLTPVCLGLAPSALGQFQFPQDITMARLFQPQYQMRALAGSEPWVLRFGVTEPGMGPPAQNFDEINIGFGGSLVVSGPSRLFLVRI